MSLAVRVVAAVSVLFAGCSLDLSNKTACNSVTDCAPGYACVAHRCGPSGGGGAGGGGGGNAGARDGGSDASPPRMCPLSTVTACPPADPGTTCEETFCGGHLWQNGVMNSILARYRILDPNGEFSPSYRNAIRAGAAAWARASSKFVTFEECTVCSGKFISVVPEDGDGIANPDEPEQRLPMPVAAGGRVSPHRIAHQWGHVAGLSHTYERADRNRYVAFDPELWCPSGGSGLPPRCAASPAGPAGLPAVTSGTFGVFDGKSKMNAFHSDGICGAEEPDEDSGEPTLGDVSAVAELFFGVATVSLPTGWSPFRPIGLSVSDTQPLDYQLAAGVDPVGSPAIAEFDYASPEIFVRGTDDRVYMNRRDPLMADWLGWNPVADDVDGDPAVVFAVNQDPPTLFLAFRSQLDGQIHLRARRGVDWGVSTSLGAPPAGAASAPALASESPLSLAILVRGGDGLIYRLSCTDATQDCASASASGVWSPLPALPPPGIFVGKPSAVWLRDVTGLTVAAISDERVAYVITSVNIGGSDWVPADNVNADLASDDPDPSVAITLHPTPGDVNLFARNQRGLLINETLLSKLPSIGGVLASPPGAVAMYHGPIRTDVAAIIDDHGRPGVWWRYNDAGYVAPCNYNLPGSCAECAP